MYIKYFKKPNKPIEILHEIKVDPIEYTDKLKHIFLPEETNKDYNEEPVYENQNDSNDQKSLVRINFNLNGQQYRLYTYKNSIIKKLHDSGMQIQNMIEKAELILDLNGKIITRDITKILKELQGPEYNFYENLSGISFKFIDLFDVDQLNELKIYNIYSYNLHIYTLLGKYTFKVTDDLDVRNFFLI